MSHRELLEQAQTASQIGNWSLLSHSLQQLLLDETSPAPSRSLFADAETAVILLDLALQVLEFGSFQERWEIAKIFPHFGTDVIDPLLAIASDEDGDPETQWFAIRILGGFNHPRVITALIEVLRSSTNEELTSTAVQALAQMGAGAIAVLANLLHEESSRLLAVQALGHIRRAETIPYLLQVVDDSDAQVRAIAIEALGSFHSPDIAIVLVKALSDLSPKVRRAAVSALGFCTKSDTAGLDVVEKLQPLLRDFNLDVCCQTAISLSRVGTPEATLALIEVLRSPHTPEPLALEIIRALGWIASSEAIDALAEAYIKFPISDATRLEIINTIGRCESPDLKLQGTTILLKLMQQSDEVTTSPIARQAIALSLSRLGNPVAIEPLLQLLSDADVGVRLHVVSALRTLDASRAYQALSDLSQQTDRTSALGEGIAIALQEWNPPRSE